MVERLLITLVAIGVAVALHRGYQWWMLRRTSRLQASNDPLLVDFAPGRPGILYFTADFCATCNLQQLPALAKVMQQIGKDDIQIIQIDAEANADDAQRWGVMSLPTTFILAPDGKPKAVNYGVASADKLLRQLQQATQS